jgi:hypothetical protein
MVLNDRRIVVVIIEVGRCKVEDDDGEGLMEGGR